MNTTVRVLAIVLLSSSIAFSQAKPSSGGTGPSTSPRPTTTTPTTPTAPRNNIPPVQEQMPIFLTGRVVMDDGTPPPDRATVERVCNGRAIREGYTDSKGYFSLTIGGANNPNMMMQDASTSGSGMDGMGMGSMSPGLQSSSGAMGGNIRQGLFGCELRAALPGTISEVVELSQHVMNSLTDPNVGTIVLHRIGKVDGSSVSITSLQAPKDAKKAFDKAKKEFKKEKFDDAKAELTRAVQLYPNYAEAWSLLGETLMRSKDFPHAIEASQKAITADSHFITPYFTLITAAASQQDWKNTAQFADKLISLDAYHYPAAYYYDALAYMQMNDLDKAHTSIVAARKYDLSATLPKAALLMGEILMRQQDFAGAVGAYKAYLERVPTGPSSDFARDKLNAAQAKLAAAVGPAPAAPQQK